MGSSLLLALAAPGGRNALMLAALAVLLLSLAGAAQGQEASMRKLLMPGPLISAHAEEEENCTACHQSFAKEAQDELCLDCHTEVADDISSSEGMHGRRYQVDTGCNQCHRDHLGRDADITSLDADSFDHRLTDFPLTGAHRLGVCSSCHEAGKTFREAPGQCIDCHDDDDIHRGALGESCGDCHDDSSWGKLIFDHDSTDFPLRGQHMKTSCAACHPAERFEDTPKQCHDCHSLNDVHGGQRGQDCGSCHGVSEWTTNSFDHNEETDFDLLGAHTELRCQACHVDMEMEQVAGDTCDSCHLSDDVHNGRNGTQCQDCHDNERWKDVRFDHDKDTKFPLRGKHSKLTCEACHFGGALDLDNLAGCDSCHAGDDPHRGARGQQCDQCHEESGWEKVRFDHDLSGFPLLGMHTGLSCDSCHIDQAYGEVGSTCDDCHQQDDYHKGHLGQQCESCHNPTDWTRWQFDHDKQTDFSLTGSHAPLLCLDCHTSTRGGNTSSACSSCHRDDDRHSGRFGRDCARCHNTESFDQVQIGR
jgi:hypothetical protein